MTNVYKIENLLQCAICLERFRTPKVLDCQHTFCLTCLQNIYNTQNQTLTCPTCRRKINLNQGPDELPNNLLIISLLDVQPVRAKCPCCQKIETLTICEHCHCTKCRNCNEKHVDSMRQTIETTFDELQNTNQSDLKVSIHNSFKTARNKICNQFQQIRQQHNSNLLKKQMNVIKQIDSHEQTLLTQVENDLQPLEQSKLGILRKNIRLNTKNESELLDVLTTASDLQCQLAKKIAEYHSHLTSIKLSLQYDKDQFHQICHSFHLNITTINEEKCDKRTNISLPSEPIYLTLRTFLNQEYKCRITLDKTIYQLKEILSKQENINPNHIILTKLDNYFDKLNNNRSLKSYDCDSTTIFMIYLQK